jgi:hypothetical protein
MPETQLPAHALGRVEAHLENLVDQTRDMTPAPRAKTAARRGYGLSC